MTTVLDAFGPLPTQQVKASGASGVMRYLAPHNHLTEPKIATLAQVQEERYAGLDVGLNWEWYETRPLNGYAAGQQDALLADQQADGLGYPLASAIYYSVDTGASWGQVEGYFRGIHDVSRRPVGLYGGVGLWVAARDRGLAQYGWITNAASWSGLSRWTQVRDAAHASGAHLLQHLHDATFQVPGVPGSQYDANDVLQPNWGQWSAGGTVPAPPGPPASSHTNPTLRAGAHGDVVKVLQARLNYKLGAHLAVDGSFGPATDAAVRQYQHNIGAYLHIPFAVDGIVGPATWFWLAKP